MVAISIIATSYSMERLNDIRDLLDSISRQIRKNFELVYITEGEWHLYNVVKAEVDRTSLNAQVVHNEGRPGLAEARNLGASVANGDILGFVDDDVILDSKWSAVVEDAFKVFGNVVGTTGPAYPLWVGTPAEWLPSEYDWLIGCTRWFNSGEITEIRNCWGMNMTFLHSSFEKVGGFLVETGYHRGEMAEDVDISLRVRNMTGGKLLYLPNMVVKSKVYPYRLSDRFVIERSSWIGHSRRAVGHGDQPQGTRGPERVLLVSLVRLLLTGSVFKDAKTLTDMALLLRLITLSTASLVLGYLIGPLATEP